MKAFVLILIVGVLAAAAHGTWAKEKTHNDSFAHVIYASANK